MNRRVVETLLATRALDKDRCELDPMGPLQGGPQGFFRLSEVIFVDRRDGDAANPSNAFETRHPVWERLDCHPVAISRCLRAIIEISNVHFVPLYAGAAYRTGAWLATDFATAFEFMPDRHRHRLESGESG
ncbi:MAG: hypothetical protein K2P68_10965 [Sphingomonas sp.]|nr:hypothetical protein [Sphingomonas sp.]